MQFGIVQKQIKLEIIIKYPGEMYILCYMHDRLNITPLLQAKTKTSKTAYTLVKIYLCL